MTNVYNADFLNRYPEDQPGEYEEDDGTMPENINSLGRAVIGHKIVSAEIVESTAEILESFPDGEWVNYSFRNAKTLFQITLDNGQIAYLANTADCCAYTVLEAFWLDPESVNHIIMGVGSTEGYTTWHVYADYGDILRLQVGWSCGNPFYYGYGFDVKVVTPEPKGDVPGVALILMATGEVRWAQVTGPEVEEG
jgi:hypothetical protein